jgi:putative mycofactocin binding protein MftB
MPPTSLLRPGPVAAGAGETATSGQAVTSGEAATSGQAVTAGRAAGAPFDLDGAWQLHPQVSVRPERFGALLYHFGTRRLSFCKNTTVAAVIQTLAAAPSARAACLDAGVPETQLPIYQAALGALAASQTIVARGEAA